MLLSSKISGKFHMKTLPHYFHFVLIGFILLSLSCSSAAEEETSEQNLLTYEVPAKITEDSPSNFFGRPEEYLEWEAENTLDLVDEILARFPPATDETIIRHSAFQ